MAKLQIKTRVGTISYDVSSRKWTAEEGDPSWTGLLVAEAERLSIGYSYSPADGQPGARLVQDVANKMGGKAIISPCPPVEEGVVY